MCNNPVQSVQSDVVCSGAFRGAILYIYNRNAIQLTSDERSESCKLTWQYCLNWFYRAAGSARRHTRGVYFTYVCVRLVRSRSEQESLSPLTAYARWIDAQEEERELDEQESMATERYLKR